MIDQDLVQRIQKTVGDRLHAARKTRAQAGQSPLTAPDEHQFARTLIADVLREEAAMQIAAGLSPLDPDSEQELADGVHARIFGSGRLQPLLDDETIENIDFNGCDEVWVTRAGQAKHERVGPIARTDEELIGQIQQLGSYAGLNSRPFDSANPELDLRLADGSRLSAVMGVTSRPCGSIRRHRFEKVTLEDLVGNDTLGDDAAEFLRALVRARMNIMIAGATRAGKTTLLRAMAAEISPEERLITVEKSLELDLRKQTEQHPNCVEFEARLANSEGQGAIAMSRLVQRTLRMNPDRVIVGEVLGDEVIDMLNAMGQGNDGSLSTIHARSSRDVFNRIATYAIQARERLPHEATFQLIAGGLDYIVYVSQHPGSGLRRLDSVLEVNGYDNGVGVQASEIFAAHGDLTAQWTGTMPARVDRLAAAGWTPPSTARGW